MKAYYLSLFIAYGMAVLFATSDLQAVNFKILELEVDKYHNKLLSKSPLTEKEVEYSLTTFVEEKDEDTVPHKLVTDFFGKPLIAFEDEGFKKFFDICSSIQIESSSELEKRSVYILFQNVLDKFSKSLEIIKRAKKLQKSESNDTDFFREFVNADKSLPFFTFKTVE